MGHNKAVRDYEPSPVFIEMVRQRIDELFPNEPQFLTAHRVGINPSYWSNILKRRVPPPSLNKVISIARALQLDVIELARLAGYELTALTDPDGSQSEIDLTKALAQALTANAASKLHLNDYMAILIGKYFEIQSNGDSDEMASFISEELLPVITTEEAWASDASGEIRAYRRVGEDFLKILRIAGSINCMQEFTIDERVSRRQAHRPSRTPQGKQPRSRPVQARKAHHE
jgi:hypothetical protein